MTEKQKELVLEVLNASKVNAFNGKDAELVSSFNELLELVDTTQECITMKRPDAETIMDFCIMNVESLDKALSFLSTDTDRSKEEVEDLINRVNVIKDEFNLIVEQIKGKIDKNPKR